MSELLPQDAPEFSLELAPPPVFEVGTTEVSRPGPQGEKGDPFTYSDFTSEQLESLRGPRGLQGEPGRDGQRGLPGRDGTPGRPGADGQPGRDGADGKSAYQVAVQNGFQGTEQAWLQSLKGERGQDGRPGADGLPGTTDYNQLQNKPDLSQYLPKTGGTVTGKLNVASGSAPAGDKGDINMGAGGFYAYRSSDRYIRLNNTGTVADLDSFGADLAIGYDSGSNVTIGKGYNHPAKLSVIGNQTIGTRTFANTAPKHTNGLRVQGTIEATNGVEVPGPSSPSHATSKAYVDNNFIKKTDQDSVVNRIVTREDARIGNGLRYEYESSTTPQTRQPSYLNMLELNERSLVDSIGAFSGQKDVLYLADRIPGVLFKSHNMGDRVERLLNGSLSDSVLLNTKAITPQNPAWVSVEYEDSSSGYFGSSDVIRLMTAGHRLYRDVCILHHYKIEVKGKNNNWSTIVERQDVNDNANKAVWPLHVNGQKYDDGKASYHTIKGFRLTIYSVTGPSWGGGKAYLAVLQMRDTRPGYKPAAGVGAVDIGGGTVYGDLEMRHSYLRIPTGSSIRFNTATILGRQGFPEGVISASPGTIYIDESATNGAVIWVKKTGHSTTGWAVMHGDTGWIKISSWGSDGVVSGATLPANAGVKASSRGGIWIRRENYNIHWRFAGMRFVGSAAFPIPAGFNCDPYFVQVPVVLGSRVSRASIGTAAIYMGESGVEIDSDYAAYVTYKGTSNWPTNLPRNV